MSGAIGSEPERATLSSGTGVSDSRGRGRCGPAALQGHVLLQRGVPEGIPPGSQGDLRREVEGWGAKGVGEIRVVAARVISRLRGPRRSLKRAAASTCVHSSAPPSSRHAHSAVRSASCPEDPQLSAADALCSGTADAASFPHFRPCVTYSSHSGLTHGGRRRAQKLPDQRHELAAWEAPQSAAAHGILIEEPHVVPARACGPRQAAAIARGPRAAAHSRCAPRCAGLGLLQKLLGCDLHTQLRSAALAACVPARAPPAPACAG